VLDQGFATGRSLGTSGTPSAVLVDAKGTIASSIAKGAPAVLAPAGAGRAEALTVLPVARRYAPPRRGVGELGAIDPGSRELETAIR
jgi:hypothetical protein